jgi:hypothetical protein
MQPEEIYHKGEEGAQKQGLKAFLHPFVFLASRSSPWCPFVVNILISGSFAYPVI